MKLGHHNTCTPWRRACCSVPPVPPRAAATRLHRVRGFFPCYYAHLVRVSPPGPFTRKAGKIVGSSRFDSESPRRPNSSEGTYDLADSAYSPQAGGRGLSPFHRAERHIARRRGPGRGCAHWHASGRLFESPWQIIRLTPYAIRRGVLSEYATAASLLCAARASAAA